MTLARERHSRLVQVKGERRPLQGPIIPDKLECRHEKRCTSLFYGVFGVKFETNESNDGLSSTGRCAETLISERHGHGGSGALRRIASGDRRQGAKHSAQFQQTYAR